MRSLFCPDGTVALRRAVETSALLVFDFDGTLAPIVEDPSEAITPPSTVEYIRNIMTRFKVAVVSGRSAADLAPRLGFEPTYLVGNHGAEGLDDAQSAEADAASQWLRAQVQGAQLQLEDVGVTFEDKGLSWTFHYRQAPDHAMALREVRQLLEPLDGRLHAFDGKCCVNVVLRDAATKGHAVEVLAARAGAGSVVYMGDDVTDESVYRLSRPSWLTIHVGLVTQTSGATFYVDTQRDVVTVLRRIDGLAKSLYR
jgi:trehalose 6-phosphate phosphatase